jgi:hypothetical protein
MTDRFATDPANFGAMNNEAYVDFRDRFVRELGEDTGLSLCR